MTERIYKHRTATDHYMQSQMLLAQARKAYTAPAYAALLLQEAQVHATLATARIEPFLEIGQGGPISVSEHCISRFRSEMEVMGLNPDEWELEPHEKNEN